MNFFIMTSHFSHLDARDHTTDPRRQGRLQTRFLSHCGNIFFTSQEPISVSPNRGFLKVLKDLESLLRGNSLIQHDAVISW